LKSAPAPQAAAKNDEESDEDDDDFFASSDDDEEAAAAAEALKAKRVAEYNARKAEKAAKKGVVAAKSMITLDVKPFDDETDLDALAAKIKSEIAMDGLVWGQKHEKKPLAFGIFKLVVTAVVEDDKVSTDDLTEKIEEYDDEVQSVDIAAFNKL
jgi:elongation factor 1-beta